MVFHIGFPTHKARIHLWWLRLLLPHSPQSLERRLYLRPSPEQDTIRFTLTTSVTTGYGGDGVERSNGWAVLCAYPSPHNAHYQASKAVMLLADVAGRCASSSALWWLSLRLSQEPMPSRQKQGLCALLAIFNPSSRSLVFELLLSQI